MKYITGLIILFIVVITILDIILQGIALTKDYLENYCISLT